MNFKYYDVLSRLVVGYILLVVGLFSFNVKYNSDYTVAYFAVAFLCGYIVNAVGSLFEPLYYFTIGGKPSTRLLNENKETHHWIYYLFIPKNNGIKKVRFYETEKVRKLLMNGLESENPSEDRLFSKAMREVNGGESSRVSDFNAHYALARTVLTAVLISAVLIISSYPCYGKSYLLIVVLLICWNRYRERAYYYAREVLNEYLKKNEK